jgi:hypothetical protein
MTKKRILGCLRVPPVEYHCSRALVLKLWGAPAGRRWSFGGRKLFVRGTYLFGRNMDARSSMFGVRRGADEPTL